MLLMFTAKTKEKIRKAFSCGRFLHSSYSNSNGTFVWQTTAVDVESQKPSAECRKPEAGSYPASACRMLRIAVCARLSTTATSPSSKLNGSGANTISSPTVSRS
jgi:hypothetical protein